MEWKLLICIVLFMIPTRVFGTLSQVAEIIPIVESSQQQTEQKKGRVKGVVTDSDKQAMIGVNVAVIKGNSVLTGVVTDLNGKFELDVPEGCQLRFTFIGYKTLFLAPLFEKTMTIQMERDSQEIEEVVVNGFFTRSKQTFTGAAKTLTQEQILSISPNNIFQALSTLDSSIQLPKNNEMGSSPNVVPELIIRSTTSLATGDEVGLNSPLIVIDGVESTLQDLYDININDIERIDILKDASATALYGENAANGVICVERIRVRQAPLRVRYSTTLEASFADLSSYDLCNAAQKLELERIAGLYNSSTGALDKDYYDKLALVSQGVDIDWGSKPVRNSFSHDHSISLSGRGSGLEYNITGKYSDTKGVMKNDGRISYGMDVYLSYRLKEKLILTLRAGHSQLTTKNSNYGSYSDWLMVNPYDSPYDEVGELRRELSWGNYNPLYEASLSSFDKSKARSQNLSLSARYNFKTNLYVTAQGSYTTSMGTSDLFKSPESGEYLNTVSPLEKGSYVLSNSTSDNYSFKVVGNWIHSFDNKGTMFTFNVGGEVKKSNSTARTTIATGFLSNSLADYAYAGAYYSTPSGSESLNTSVGAFAAANFTLKNRYIVDGSYRMSGSSQFGANNRYAPFWAVGVGYNLHNEEFIKKLGLVNMLRLRGSYGYTGSVKFNSFQAITTYKYQMDNIHLGGIGAVPIAMPNPDLKWQITKKMNVGLTSSFWKERINVNVDYYQEWTDDMLIDVSLPPSSGTVSVKDNLGSQVSKGIDFSVWVKPIQTQNFSWTLTFNGIHSKTEIKEISDALKRQNENNGNITSEVAPRILFQEGGSPTAINAVRSAGIDPASGKEIYIKKDGTYTYEYDTQDKVVVGEMNPTLQGSISTSINYKSFYIGLNFAYTFGGDIYNQTRASKIENINSKYNADVRAFTERWKQPGDVVPYLAIQTEGGTSYVHSSRFVEKENEIVLSSVNFAYEFPQKMLEKWGIQRLRLGVGSADLFRLSTVRYERGTSYPYSRTINMTLSVTF